jgi:hypothetical protein
MSTTFILVWVLVSFDSYASGLAYSPPMQTLEDCKRLQEVSMKLSHQNKNTCVQLNILRGAQR